MEITRRAFMGGAAAIPFVVAARKPKSRITVVDNGDGTITWSGPDVIDNGDGTFTLIGVTADASGVFTV